MTKGRPLSLEAGDQGQLHTHITLTFRCLRMGIQSLNKDISNIIWDVLDKPIWLSSPSSEEYGSPVRPVSTCQPLWTSPPPQDTSYGVKHLQHIYANKSVPPTLR